MYVYIISNKKLRPLYVGVTNNLERRINEHRAKFNRASFSCRYNLNRLLYYEEIEQPYEAILREKQLKNWHREWKLNLIGTLNPGFIDLAREWG